MAKYSISQIKQIGQPPSVMNRRVAEHWSGPSYMRKISPYLSALFLKFKVAPTAITWLMVLTGWVASWVLTQPFIWAVVLVVILAQLQMLLDCSDGEVARVSQRYSPAGIFVDRIGHYTTEGFFAVAFGLRIYQNGTLEDLVWGLALALIIVFNKLLNDLVHVTRALSGLDKLTEDPQVSKVNNYVLQKIKILFSFVPIHRAFHSIELSLIFLTAAIVQYWWIAEFERWTLQVLTIGGMVVLIGHALAILNSNRLKG